MTVECTFACCLQAIEEITLFSIAISPVGHSVQLFLHDIAAMQVNPKPTTKLSNFGSIILPSTIQLFAYKMMGFDARD